MSRAAHASSSESLVLPSVAERYAELCRTPSDIFRHLPRLVTLVHETNARHVVELGTRSGVSTVAFLHALATTGGTLTSVDIDPAPDLGVGDVEHWRFVQGDDLAPDVVRDLADADIVFIDTSHHYEHTTRELAVYRHVVRPGGFIVLHDTELEHPEGAPAFPRFPVRRAVEEFCAREGFAWINFRDCYGLGVIHVER